MMHGTLTEQYGATSQKPQKTARNNVYGATGTTFSKWRKTARNNTEQLTEQTPPQTPQRA